MRRPIQTANFQFFSRLCVFAWKLRVLVAGAGRGLETRMGGREAKNPGRRRGIFDENGRL